MNESQLLILLIACLDAGILAYNALNLTGPQALPSGLVPQKAFQSRQEGAPSNPAIIVSHAGNVPRGNMRRTNVWNAGTTTMNYTYSQRMESTYHVEALVPQSPATPNVMTEADVLNIARFMLQSDATIATLLAQGVSLLRVAKMDSNYIEDDKDQNENVPYFEITFQYRWSLTTTAPTIDVFNPGIYPI